MSVTVPSRPSGTALEEGNVLTSVVAFHFLAGAVTGSILAVRTLLTVVALVVRWGDDGVGPFPRGFGHWEA